MYVDMCPGCMVLVFADTLIKCVAVFAEGLFEGESYIRCVCISPYSS